MMQQDDVQGPSGAAGMNGSPNQGNMGATDTGVVQQPGADGAEGMVIGSNLALGIDGAANAQHLIAYNGMTLYTYSKDSDGTSVCVDECAKNWPPYVVGAEDNLTQLKAGVNGKVSTITRADGTLQVTYNGKPLYFYKNDTKSGDTTGDKIGNVWFVVKP
jgi:predicted lipoprotein with Yx(FWY)xxD motif